MSRSPLPLDLLNVPTPCAVPWQSMSGTDRVRFCPDCRKVVHNLSAMTAAEIDAIVRDDPNGPCVRFRRRADGTIVTAEGRGGRLARAWVRLTTALSAAFVGLASLAGCDCAQLGVCTQGKLVAPPPAQPPAPAAVDVNEE
ncbi:MAG TPA: hypothetical protein VKD90_13895 [Gemmataceae bacterium]|nr:hypothetical protein [Gemmataceae bacterium]